MNKIRLTRKRGRLSSLGEDVFGFERMSCTEE